MVAGDVRNIADTTRLVFKPVVDIAQLLLMQEFDADELEMFLRRLEFGVPNLGVEFGS